MAFRAIGACPMLAPVPVVMISSAGEASGVPNIFTAAWTGTVCSKPPMLSVSIRRERLSYELIRKSGEFVVNLVGSRQMNWADYCGVKSGREVNKFEQLGLTPVSASPLAIAPAIAECPVHLPCRVRQIISLGSHDLFLADILDVYVEDAYFRRDGSLNMDKMALCAYSHGEYRPLGDVMGFFGYSVASKDVIARRLGRKNKGETAKRRKV